jgi:hypothetical protein
MVVTVILIGLSISLLIYSHSIDKKGVKILLLFYGRVLIITQVSSNMKLVKANIDLT